MARDRIGAALGLLGVAGNVAGVAFLVDVSAAYRPAQLDAWLAQAVHHPGASAASAVAFVVGLAALGAWARALGARAGPGLRHASGAMAAGAWVNAAGCVAPLVLLLHVLPACTSPEACAPVARALLGSTLALDAAFNLFFGVGLVGAGVALLSGGSRGLGALGVAAGVVTVLVSGQVVSERAASLLALAAPLWLAFVVAASVQMWRAPAPERP